MFFMLICVIGLFISAIICEAAFTQTGIMAYKYLDFALTVLGNIGVLLYVIVSTRRTKKQDDQQEQ